MREVVGADVGLGDAERHDDLAGGDLREVFLLEAARKPCFDDGHRRKHVEVDRRGAAGAAPAAQISCSRMAASVTPSPEPPYGLGNDRAQPAGAREGLDEVPRVLVLAVLLEPVVERRTSPARVATSLRIISCCSVSAKSMAGF